MSESKCKYRALPLTLPSLSVALVQVPVPMTEADFTFLVEQITGWKEAIVEKRDEMPNM